MGTIVIEATSLSSGTGWTFDNGEAVACFALVKVIDDDVSNPYPVQMVIPLRGTDLFCELKGTPVDLMENDVKFTGG